MYVREGHYHCMWEGEIETRTCTHVYVWKWEIDLLQLCVSGKGGLMFAPINTMCMLRKRTISLSLYVGRETRT